MIIITDNGDNSITFNRNGLESYLQKTKIVEVDVVNDGVMLRLKSGRTIRIDSYTDVSGYSSAEELAEDINNMLSGGGCQTITLDDLNTEVWVSSPFSSSGPQTAATASGGVGPYTYEVTAGVLPNGLSLNANSGEITGTTDLVSHLTPHVFTITATDSNNCTGSKEYTIIQNEAFNYRARVQSNGDDLTATILIAWIVWFYYLGETRPKIKRYSRLLTDTFIGFTSPAILNNDGTTTYLGFEQDVNEGPFLEAAWGLDGVQGNGMNYLDTGFVLADHTTQNNLTLAVGGVEVSNVLSKEIGAETGGGISAYVILNSSAIGGSGGTMNDFSNDATTAAVGLSGVTRTGVNSKRSYSGGNTSTSSPASLGEIPFKVFVFGSNSGGSLSLPSSRKIQNYLIGDGFDLVDFENVELANAQFNSVIGI